MQRLVLGAPLALLLALLAGAIAVPQTVVAAGGPGINLCKTITQSGAPQPLCAPATASPQGSGGGGGSGGAGGSSGCGVNIVSAASNASGFPASDVPYGCPGNASVNDDGQFVGYSPLNQKVSASPTYMANSATLITAMFTGTANPSRPNGWTGTYLNVNAGEADSSHAVVFASATDPQITLTCHNGCTTDYGSTSPTVTLRIPANASFPGAEGTCTNGDDHHLGVVQPDGTEYDLYFYGGNSSNPGCTHGYTGGTPWADGTSYDISGSFIGKCGNGWNVATSPGLYSVNGGGTTAGSMCDPGGIIRAAELNAGAINHALAIVIACASGTQYPAPVGAGTSSCQGDNLNVPLGGHLWLDYTDAQIAAMSGCQPYQKAILTALHDYGGFVMDDGTDVQPLYLSGSGFSVSLESSQAYYDFGPHSGDNGNPYDTTTLKNQGWTSWGVPGSNMGGWLRWGTYGDNAQEMFCLSAAQWAAHAHWLDACAAKGTC